jgi:hypothetical protein
MQGSLDTAGERVVFDCSLPWVAEVIVEGAGSELQHATHAEGTIAVRIEADGQPFADPSWELLARGVWRRHGEVVVENACTSGFDLHLDLTRECFELTYRWRPPIRDRVAARVLRSRFHLLARSVLMQYPALWVAGTRGRVPVHASALIVGSHRPLVTAASGIGRSTLVLGEVRAGAHATSDNLGVTDGMTVWGLVEPVRASGARGRRMPHGRRESSMPSRVDSVDPECIVVLERGREEHATLEPRSADQAARSLAAATYMAGELRRYWAFAATLAAATGRGPVHPEVTETVALFAAALPSFTLALGRRPADRALELLVADDLAA